jgi:hypothetical protein
MDLPFDSIDRSAESDDEKVEYLLVEYPDGPPLRLG